MTKFQSTLPTRGSDSYGGVEHIIQGISIHAPHEGERRLPSAAAPQARDFNPRSPRGGATSASAVVASFPQISILAPHEGERPAC